MRSFFEVFFDLGRLLTVSLVFLVGFSFLAIGVFFWIACLMGGMVVAVNKKSPRLVMAVIAFLVVEKAFAFFTYKFLPVFNVADVFVGAIIFAASFIWMERYQKRIPRFPT